MAGNGLRGMVLLAAAGNGESGAGTGGRSDSAFEAQVRAAVAAAQPLLLPMAQSVGRRFRTLRVELRADPPVRCQIDLATLTVGPDGGSPGLTFTVEPTAWEAIRQGTLAINVAYDKGLVGVSDPSGELLLFLIGPTELDMATDCRQTAREAREAHWARWGARVEGGPDDRIEFLGPNADPRWPGRERYAVLRVGRRRVIVTDGLSDSFEDDASRPDGFGVELWLETDAKTGSPAGEWALELVKLAAEQVVEGLPVAEALEEHGVVPMEVPLENLSVSPAWPKHFVGPSGTLVVMLGLTNPAFPEYFDGVQGSVRYVNVRLLTAAEGEALRRDGLEAAQEITGGRTLCRLAPK